LIADPSWAADNSRAHRYKAVQRMHRCCMDEAALVEASNKKLAAGLLAIFLGFFGLHKFVLGYTTSGVIMLVVTVLTCGFGGFVMGVIGLVEGIIYLTKTPEDFQATYIDGRKEWF
jgi:TM2 domain-containing membrane protein YozV